MRAYGVILFLPSLILFAGCDKHKSTNPLFPLEGKPAPTVPTEERVYLMMGQSNLSRMPASYISDPLAQLGIGGNVFNCADGGTWLHQWQKGQPLYEAAVSTYRNNRAHSGKIAGVFFWQGEAEGVHGTPDQVNTWAQRFTQMVRDLRADLGEPDLRVVFMQIGILDSYPNAQAIKDQQASVYIPNVFMTNTNGFPPDPDGHHFGLHYRELGERMAVVMAEGDR